MAQDPPQPAPPEPPGAAPERVSTPLPGARTRVKVVSQLPPLARFGRYEVLGRLAYGGMAEILLARERLASGAMRPVVVKRVLPHVAENAELRRMFHDEARLVAHLRHPNICHVYDVGEHEGSPFLVMEWVDGVSLGRIIRRSRERGGVPVPVAVRIASTVAEALHHAHRACDESGRPLGLVHRDVSPQNVMVAFDGTVKLLDFGVARAASAAERTRSGVVKGKFAYMAPEQCTAGVLDGRADVFSLGVCLFESLTGRGLYHRPTEYETMRAILEEPPPSVRHWRPEVPEDLDAIVRRALQKRPEDRFPDAGAFHEALEGWLARHGEVVTGARLEGWLAEVFGDEIARGPLVDSSPFGTSLHGVEPPTVAAGSAGGQEGPAGEDEASGGGRGGALPRGRAVAFVVALLGLVVGLGYLLSLGFLAGGRKANGPPPGDGKGAPAAVASERGTAAETAEAPASGALRVSSSPPGARVWLDGEALPGRTPLRAERVAAGEHRLQVRLDGRQPWSGTVRVAPGRDVSVDVALVEEPAERVAPGSRPPASERVAGGRGAARGARAASPARVGTALLSVQTRPWSEVFLGSRSLGMTPLGRVRVPAGRLRLRFVDRDGREHRRTLRLAPGEHRTLALDFEQGP